MVDLYKYQLVFVLRLFHPVYKMLKEYSNGEVSIQLYIFFKTLNIHNLKLIRY